MIVHDQQGYIREQYPMIATPCYGGLVNEPYLRGMTQLTGAAISLNMGVNMATITNESLVTRARNELVKYFMMTDCTHLFFIDADIVFSADDVLRILLHDKDVVVGAYPLKRVAWENIDTTSSPDVDTIKRMATDYVINIKFTTEEQHLTKQVPVVDGLVEVHDAGTGFMCIKRHVIEKMIEAYPESHYSKEPKHVMHDGDDGTRWALFDTMIDEDNRYLSEDYTFCRRWQKLGGKIWLDPAIQLSHVGTFTFPGCVIVDISSDNNESTQKTNQLVGGGLLGG
jgi:hypothetical protein